MKRKLNGFSIVAVSFLITGQLVGAGILGIPVIAGITGFFPALIIMTVLCMSMLFTALVLGKEASDKADDYFSFPSLYEEYLGKIVKWIAIGINMLLLYGLLTAYIAGGTSIISSLFFALKIDIYKPFIVLSFFIVLTSFTLTGVTIVKKYTSILLLLMWISFIALIVIGFRYVDKINYEHMDWIFFPATIPIIITSFNFSNLIPVVSKSLDWKMSYVWKAILIGMIIALIMNITWISVGIGILPLYGEKLSLIAAFTSNTPATVPIAAIVRTPAFIVFSLVFSLIAITTSYIGNGLGLISFNTDLIYNFLKVKSKYLIILVTFIPPLLITIFYPDIFIKMLNITGGVCTATLFGIFPSIIAIVKYKSKIVKAIGICTTCIFCISLSYIIGDISGFVRITLPTQAQQNKNLKTIEQIRYRVYIKGINDNQSMGR
jgi:tyrosine-specific transport protein